MFDFIDKILDCINQRIRTGRAKLFPTITRATYNHGHLIVYFSDGTKKEYQYRSCSWYELPMMTDVTCFSSPESGQLREIRIYIEQWGNDYPDAHLKR